MLLPIGMFRILREPEGTFLKGTEINARRSTLLVLVAPATASHADEPPFAARRRAKIRVKVLK